MQSRLRLLPLFGILITTAGTAAITAACGGDDKTVYIYVTDAGSDAGQLRDSGITVVPGDDDDSGATGGSCQPGQVAAFTFKPAARYQNKCQQSDIDSFVNGCFADNATDDGCTAAQTALPDDCFSCLVGTPQDATTHPFNFYATSEGNVGPVASTGVCMAAYANDGTSTSDCSYAFGEVETCAYEACVPQCLQADESSFQDCIQASLSSTCTTGTATFTSTKCKSEYNGSMYGFCLGEAPDGGMLSNTDYTAQVAALVCGAPPADGGTDAGADAGDAGDSGDAGDAGTQQ